MSRSFVDRNRTGGIQVHCRLSPQVRAIDFSGSGYRAVLDGLLVGTLGRDPRGARVAVASRLLSRRDEVHVSVVSRKGKLRRMSAQGLFAHFCRKAKRRDKAKVKLSCSGVLIRLRNNSVNTHGGRRTNTAFFFRLPLGRGARRVVYRPGTCLGRLVNSGSGRRVPSRSGFSAAPCDVLMISSGSSLASFLGGSLKRCFGQVMVTTSNMRTLRLVGDRAPSVVIDSMVVPQVGKCRLYGGVGRSVAVDRVPVVLLATESSGRDRLDNCGGKTSTCLAGPFRVRVLVRLVHGQLGGHRRAGGECLGTNLVPTPRRDAFDRTSRAFLLGVGGVVRRGLSGDGLSITLIYGRVNVDQTSLCGGLGTLASVKTGSCVGGFEVRGTVALVANARLSFARVTRGIKFAASHCFDATFGRCANRAPARCGRGQGRRGGGR